jgi:hypothetical protein
MAKKKVAIGYWSDVQITYSKNMPAGEQRTGIYRVLRRVDYNRGMTIVRHAADGTTKPVTITIPKL